MDIVRQTDAVGHKIDATIIVDETTIIKNNIIYKSFKDNINPPSIQTSGINGYTQVSNNIYNHYMQLRAQSNLPHTLSHLLSFSYSWNTIEKILLEKYDKQKVQGNTITREEIRDILPDDFIWQPNDMFSKNIGDIFFSYAQKLSEQKVKCYDNKTELDANFLTSEPWTTLNELFNDLKFEYNFKKDYKIIKAEIDEPELYPVLKNGDIDKKNPRQLSDLSDGEKAILSLSFASLNNDKMEDTVLLLDEYDATLNPSLIKMFFAVIEKFFIKKNILVIIVTHSTATLSLAPDYATFYEIFKPNDTEKRILPVKREDYQELRTANENFYKIIDNHETRTKEILENYAKLESQNKSLQEKIIKSLKPIIITEGKTDVWHLKAALKALKITDIDFEFADIDFVEWGDSELKKYLESLAKLPNTHKIIGIFDRDVSDIVKGIENNGQKYKSYGNNVYAFCIPVPSHRTDYSNISIEFYYTDNELKKEHNKKCLYFDNEVDKIDTIINNSIKETTFQLAKPIRTEKEYSKKICDNNIGNSDFMHSKTKFAELIEKDKEFVKGVNFNEFHLIFETIKEILSL